MSVKKKLLQQKMLEILEFCNFDVRDSVDYLKSEFNLHKGYVLTREKKMFEELVGSLTEDVAKSDRMTEFLEKLKGSMND